MAKNGKPGRISQMRQAYTITKQGDPNIGWILLGTFIFSFLVGLALFYVLIPPDWRILDVVTAVMVGILGTLIVFGRRATRSQLKQMEGKPGAAAAVLSMLKRGWKTDTAIAFNRQQDVVHRLVGPPGIVLIGEGNSGRLGQLLDAEKRRMNRFVADIPVTDIIVGRGEGEIPLPKLIRFLQKMPKKISGREVVDTNDRLRAIGDLMANVPIPKGPMPRNMRMPRGQNPKMR